MIVLKNIHVILLVIVFLIISAPITLASTSVTVSENGTGSNNYVSYSETSSSNINQSNSGIISNIISIFTNTGNNSSSNNTGGSSSTQTGNSSTYVSVENNLNSNYAKSSNCCSEVPEFGMIPGIVALISSGATFFYLKKRNPSK